VSDEIQPYRAPEVHVNGFSTDIAAPAPATSPLQQLWRFLGFLHKFWWIPLITLCLGVAGEAAYVHWKQPVFVSYSSMWETLKLTLPEGGVFSEDMQNFIGTQSELLQSDTLRRESLALMATNQMEIPRGNDGQPLDVAIHVTGSAKSSVFVIQAQSANPAYTQNFLNELMVAFLNYKRDARKVVSDDTLTSISEQVQRHERELRSE
jgi:hypothetical protein